MPTPRAAANPAAWAPRIRRRRSFEAPARCSTSAIAAGMSSGSVTGRGDIDGEPADARSHSVREAELGMEWQPFSSFELMAMYTLSSRRFEDFQVPNNRQRGGLLRLKAQINF